MSNTKLPQYFVGVNSCKFRGLPFWGKEPVPENHTVVRLARLPQLSPTRPRASPFGHKLLRTGVN
jgi:hypothetical protein